MVRKKLALLGQQPGWHWFRAKVGTVQWNGRKWCVCLTEVRSEGLGEKVHNHVWVDHHPLVMAKVVAGRWVRFRAHPYQYIRNDGSRDWGLKDLGRIEVVDGPVVGAGLGGTGGDAGRGGQATP